MIAYVIVGAAAAIDGFAAGIAVGKKWGTKFTKANAVKVETQVSADVATAKADEQAVEKTISEAEAWLKEHNAHAAPAPATK